MTQSSSKKFISRKVNRLIFSKKKIVKKLHVMEFFHIFFSNVLRIKNTIKITNYISDNLCIAGLRWLSNPMIYLRPAIAIWPIVVNFQSKKLFSLRKKSSKYLFYGVKVTKNSILARLKASFILGLHEKKNLYGSMNVLNECTYSYLYLVIKCFKTLKFFFIDFKHQ